MREHFKYIAAVFLSAVFTVSPAVSVFAAANAAAPAAVDRIVLNTDVVYDEEIPTDLGWKTKQDNGQWINELKIAEEVDSLVLIVNNLDKEDPHALPKQETEEKKTSRNPRKKVKEEDITGKSRLSYFSKHGDEEWHEIFSVDCFISGDDRDGKEAAYGIYRPDSSFGIKENPGSLLSYKFLTDCDYWIMDPANEQFGDIYTTASRTEKVYGGYKLQNLKTYCNYGMILKAESEDSGYPALLVNCLQNSTANSMFCGVQIPEPYLRMLVQSLDQGTRIVITDEYDSLNEIGQ